MGLNYKCFLLFSHILFTKQLIDYLAIRLIDHESNCELYEGGVHILLARYSTESDQKQIFPSKTH